MLMLGVNNMISPPGLRVLRVVRALRALKNRMITIKDHKSTNSSRWDHGVLLGIAIIAVITWIVIIAWIVISRINKI